MTGCWRKVTTHSCKGLHFFQTRYSSECSARALDYLFSFLTAVGGEVAELLMPKSGLPYDRNFTSNAVTALGLVVLAFTGQPLLGLTVYDPTFGYAASW